MRLLGDVTVRPRQFGDEAARFVRDKFSMDKMVGYDSGVYKRACHANAAADRHTLSAGAAREGRQSDAGGNGAGEHSLQIGNASSNSHAAARASTTAQELTAEKAAVIEAVWGHLHAWDAQGLHRLARLAQGPVVELAPSWASPRSPCCWERPRRASASMPWTPGCPPIRRSWERSTPSSRASKTSWPFARTCTPIAPAAGPCLQEPRSSLGGAGHRRPVHRLRTHLQRGEGRSGALLAPAP